MKKRNPIKLNLGNSLIIDYQDLYESREVLGRHLHPEFDELLAWLKENTIGLYEEKLPHEFYNISVVNSEIEKALNYALSTNGDGSQLKKVVDRYSHWQFWFTNKDDEVMFKLRWM